LGTGNSYSGKLSPEKELVKRADQYFIAANYEAALPDYSRLLSLYPQESIYNYRFGVCLLLAGNEKSNASTYLEVASKDLSIPEEVWFYLGKSYMVNNEFSKAKHAFEKFRQIAGTTKSQKFETNNFIQNCESGIALNDSRKNIVILNSIQVPSSTFYHSYDFSLSAGKLVNAAEQFLSDLDKKKQSDPVMFMSNDKQRILLSSYGKKGESGRDLYIVRKTPDNEWSQPENLGATINTSEDEDYPFLDRDGKTLYFSSKGLNSIGGYDIYKTVFDYNSNKWSTPENMGIPINTIGDDILFVPENKGHLAVYSTNVESDKNFVAVRKIQLPGGTNELLTISGTYIPLDQKVRRDARITILTNTGDGIITSVNTDPVTGAYELVLNPGETYMIVVEGGGYLAHSEMFELPDGMIDPTLRQEIKLNKSEKKEELTLLNYFTSGSGNAEPVQTISRSYPVDSDTSKLIPVVINNNVVYVTPPVSNSADENNGVSTENNSMDADSLSTIKIVRRDKYDPTLAQGLSAAEIRQQKEEEERFDEVKEEEVQAANNFDASISNDELAKAAYMEAEALKDEADSLDREAVMLRVLSEKKISLSEEQKLMAETEGTNADTAALLITESETNKIEADDLSRKADELSSLANAKEKEAIAAFNEADIIFKGKGDLASVDSDESVTEETIGITEIVSGAEGKIESPETAGSEKEENIDGAVQNVNENIVTDAPGKTDAAENKVNNAEQLSQEVSSGVAESKKTNGSEVNRTQPEPATAPEVSKPEQGSVRRSEEYDPTKPRLVLIDGALVEVSPEPVATEKVKPQPNEKQKSDAGAIAPQAAIQNNKLQSNDPVKSEIADTKSADEKVVDHNPASSLIQPLEKKEVPETAKVVNPTTADVISSANKAQPLATEIAADQVSSDNTAANAQLAENRSSVGTSVKNSRDKLFVVEEARILYEAFQEKNSNSKESTNKSLELQNRISKMSPSLERDQLIRESNDLALQSIRDREDAIKNIKEARLIDPDVEYKMGINNSTADNFVTALKEDKNAEQTESKVVENVETKNTNDQPVLKTQEASPADNQETKEQLAMMENNQEVMEKEQEKEISYSKETESEEGLDKTHPVYPQYVKIKGDITNKQVETIDVFASAVNLNKKAIEEKEKELALMDQARFEKDSVKRSSMLRESFASKDSAEKHLRISKEMFANAQEHTRAVKGLRHELAIVKYNIVSNPVKKTEAVSADSNVNIEKNEPVAIGNSIVNKNAIAKTENNGASVPAVNTEIAEHEPSVNASKAVSRKPENNLYALSKDDEAAFSVSESEVAAVSVSKQSLVDFRKTVFSMDGASPYSTANPIPMNPELPEGLVFKIQVGAFHKPLNNDVFKGLQPVSGETTRPGWIRYCVGLFRTFEPAVIAKNEVRGQGFKDAFVVAYYNGKRIELHEAYRMVKEKQDLQAYKSVSAKEVASLRAENIQANASGSNDNDVRSFYGKPLLTGASAESTNREYAIQVGVYRNSVAPILIASLNPLQTEEVKSGLFRFTYGHFTDYKQAEVAKQSAIATGVKDAFIVAYRKTGSTNVTTHAAAKIPAIAVPEEKVESKIKPEAMPSKGLVYKVQIGAYKKDIPYSLVESFEGIMDMGISKATDANDLHVFYAGNCQNYSEAQKLKEEISGKGVKDAFIVALKDGKRVPISESMKE
jgi:hypothetical protein